MKQWSNDLVHLAAAMPTTPDPGFNESLNLLRLVHNGQWSELSNLDWSALDNKTVFALAVNVLKPEALLSTPFDWLSPMKDDRDISPLAALLTAKSLRPFIANDKEATNSRAEYVSRKFWENPMVQQNFPAATQVVVDGSIVALGDIALEWNAPCAQMFLNRTWNTPLEQTRTWASFFKMVDQVPLPSFTTRNANNVFENADVLFDALPSTNPFVLSGSPNISLLQLAFRAVTGVANHKLEEQNLDRMSSDKKPMAIEMEAFTMRVSEHLSDTLRAHPTLWELMFNTPHLERNSLAVRVGLGMLFQNISIEDRLAAVEALVQKTVATNDIVWAKVIPTNPAIAVELTDNQIKSILEVCSDSYKLSWACKTLVQLANSEAQSKILEIQELNKENLERSRSKSTEKNQIEIAALVANFAHTQQIKVRKI